MTALPVIIILTIWGFYWWHQAVKWRIKWEKEVPPASENKINATQNTPSS